MIDGRAIVALAVSAAGFTGWHVAPQLADQSGQAAPPAKVIVLPAGAQGLYEAMRYAPAVRVGDMVVVSGIPAAGPGSYEEQVRRMFGRVKTILAAAGAAMEDVVEIQSFHTGGSDGAFSEEFKKFSSVHREVFTSHYPAWTATGNAALLAPGAKVEVRVVAVVGSGRNATIQRSSK